VSARSKLI